MRLLIYIEPTSYLLPLWQEIKAQSKAEMHLLFLEENLSQSWNLDLRGYSNTEVLRGNWIEKLLRLLRLMSQNNVKLVHLAGWGHPLLMVALFFAWMCRISITIESDTHLLIPTAVWKHVLKRLLFPILFRIPKIVFPAGTRQAAYFRYYGVPQSRICIAQMTVDVSAIIDRVDTQRSEKNFNEKDRSVTFLYVGRLEVHKGIQVLLDAFAELTKDDHKVYLIIVGDGKLRNHVEDFAGSHQSIEYLGRLSGNALFHAYSRADVFVLPARVEPWGLVINEAMAAGLPVIVTGEVGCIDDLIRNQENGYVVPSARSECLAEAMSFFICQPETVLAMGQKSRQIISSWTIENEASIMMTAWDGLQ